jgi:sigma-B regulation protein RsbU (phosphoserine phosphatase)
MRFLTSVFVRQSRKSAALPSGLEADLLLKDRALEATAEGIVITNALHKDNPIIYANAGFERLTGYAAADVLGSNCRLLQGPETDRAAREELSLAIRERRPCTVEILNYRKDGSRFWNRLSVTPIRNHVGDVAHFIGVQSDVTGRRQAEEALRSAKAELEATNESIRHDLETAARIQRALLPMGLPQPPGHRFAWHFLPSAQLAGDTLNVLWLSPDQVAIYIADVSGHGVSAALLSVTLSRWLSTTPGQLSLLTADSESPTGYRVSKPVEVVEKLNRQFPFDPATGQYFTLIYGILSLSAREFRYVSAGHTPVIHLPLANDARAISVAGFPVGLVSSPEYEEQIIHLRPGDRLILVTDGVMEAEGPGGEHFGLSRVVEAAAVHRSEPLERQLDRIVESSREWCSGNTFDDDVSLVGLEVLPES